MLRNPIILVFTAASSLFADPLVAETHIWFTATPISGGAGVVVNGAPGVSTVLLCPPIDPQPCRWSIGMQFLVDPGDEPILGWATDLFTDAAVGKISAVPGSLVYDHPFFTYHPVDTTYGSGPAILTNADGIEFSLAGTMGGQLAHFTLAKFKFPLGIVNIDQISARVGDVAWANVIGEAPTMQAGLNPPVPNALPGTELGDVISIYNIPEPASAFLVALCVLAMTHRRLLQVRCLSGLCRCAQRG